MIFQYFPMRRRLLSKTEYNILTIAIIGDNSLLQGGLSPILFLRHFQGLHNYRVECGGNAYKIRYKFQ